MDAVPSYTFTAADGGTHTFTPKFTYAGETFFWFTDMLQPTRTVNIGGLTVTSTPADWYSHESTPSGVKLPDGSTVWAFIGIRGRLYVRRNIGTLTEPAWRPLVTVRDVTPGLVGADSPSLVRFGSTLALFHTYTDGTYYQVWMTTSVDNGKTWSAPVQLTTENRHVQRIHAVISGGTLSLFWSRADINRKVYYRTTNDLVNWSVPVRLNQEIGLPVIGLNSNFGIAKLASGGWVLGWLDWSRVGEPPTVNPGSYDYPTVQVATSPDLVT